MAADENQECSFMSQRYNMQAKPFQDLTPLADYSLTLEVSSNALANGIAANTARATLRLGNSFLSGRTITFEVSGSARFTTNNEPIATAVTNSLGNATISFTNTVAETVSVISEYNEILARKYSTFEGGVIPPNLTLSAVVVNNNAVANDTAANTIRYTVRNASAMPVSNEQINFSVILGSAVLSPQTGFTNSQGELLLSIFSSVAGEVVVQAYLASQPAISQNTQVNFISAGITYILTVTIIRDHAPANGNTPITLLYRLVNEQSQPVGQKQLGFSVTGNATLSSTSGYTNNSGEILLSLVNTIAEQVTVTCFLISDPSVDNYTDVTFEPVD